jgi:hypothetical protein
MRSPRRWPVAVAATVAAMALAGCTSSGPAYNDAVGQSSPPGTETPLIGIVSGPGTPLPVTGGGPPTTSRIPSIPIPGRTLPGGTVAPGSASGTTFCKDLESVQSLITSLLASVASPADLNRARALLAKLVADAPPDLHPTLQTLVQLQDRVTRDLTANPPNSTDIISVFTDPAYQQSLQQLVSYSLTHCSVNLTPPTT